MNAEISESTYKSFKVGIKHAVPKDVRPKNF